MPVDHLPYAHITTEARLVPLLDELRATEAAVALDTETFDPNLEPEDDVANDEALDVRVAKVRLIQIKTAEGAPYVVDTQAVDPTPLLETLANKHVILHNAAYDLAVLRTNYGYIHRGPVTDTMLAAQVYYSGTSKTANLKDLLQRLLEVTISKDEQKAKWGAELTPAQLAYAATDVEHLHELRDVLSARVRKANLGAVVALENKMVKVTSEMSALGMPVDEEVFAECVSVSEKAIEEQLEKLDRLVSAPVPVNFVERNTKNKNIPEGRKSLFNWGSPEQAL